jgi:hypothetical protein
LADILSKSSATIAGNVKNIIPKAELTYANSPFLFAPSKLKITPTTCAEVGAANQRTDGQKTDDQRTDSGDLG